MFQLKTQDFGSEKYVWNILWFLTEILDFAAGNRVSFGNNATNISSPYELILWVCINKMLLPQIWSIKMCDSIGLYVYQCRKLFPEGRAVTAETISAISLRDIICHISCEGVCDMLWFVFTCCSMSTHTHRQSTPCRECDQHTHSISSEGWWLPFPGRLGRRRRGRRSLGTGAHIFHS